MELMVVIIWLHHIFNPLILKIIWKDVTVLNKIILVRILAVIAIILSFIVIINNHKPANTNAELAYKQYIKETKSTPDFLQYIIEEEGHGKGYKDLGSKVTDRSFNGTEITSTFSYINSRNKIDTSDVIFLVKGNGITKR